MHLFFMIYAFNTEDIVSYLLIECDYKNTNMGIVAYFFNPPLLFVLIFFPITI